MSTENPGLRLSVIGIVALSLFAALFLTLCAWLVTLVSTPWAVAVYLVLGTLIGFVTWHISQVDMGR